MQRIIVSVSEVEVLHHILRRAKQIQEEYGVFTEADLYDLYNDFLWAGIDIPFYTMKNEITDLDKARIEYIKSYSKFNPIGGAYIRFPGEDREPRTLRMF